MKDTKRIFNKETGKIERVPLENPMSLVEINNDNKNPISKSLLITSFNKGLITNADRKDIKIRDCYIPRKLLSQMWDLYENNTMHSRCVDLKTDLTVGLGCEIINLAEIPNADEIAVLRELKMHPNTDKLATFRKMIWNFVRDYYALGNAYLELLRSNVDGTLRSWRYRPAHRIFKAIDRKGYWLYYDLQNTGKRRYLNTFDDKDDASANEVYHLVRPDQKSDYYGIMQAFSAIKDIEQVDFTKRHLSAWYKNNAAKVRAMFFKPGAYELETFQHDVKQLFENKFVGVDNWYKNWIAEVDKDDFHTVDFQETFDEEKISTLLKTSQAEIALANGVPLTILDYFESKGTVSPTEAMRNFLQMSISPNQELIQTDLFNILNITDGVEETAYEFKKFDTTTQSQDIGALSQLSIILEKLTNIPEDERGGLTDDALFGLIREILESANIKEKLK